MSDEPEQITKHDFVWVKGEVSKSLDDEQTKRLWSSLLNWLENDGEVSGRKELEVVTQSIRTDGLSRFSNLESKLPPKE